MRRFTKDEWRAISEALAFRLCDDIEDGDLTLDDYMRAFEKVQERLDG